MIIEITCLIILVLVTAFVANTIDNIRKKNNSKISFKESVDLTTLPIVTFYCGKSKLNLLLDTGSNSSFINKEDVPTNIKLTKYEESVIGEAFNAISDNCIMPLYYNNKNFMEEFKVVDLSKSIEDLKNSTGVHMHGILGSNFFTKYKYILDFDTMIFYNKK